MEQKVYIAMGTGFHSALHAKNVEHVHAGVKPPLYVSRWSRETTECIEATISFDEEKVAGWLDLSPEHQYDFSREEALPVLKDGKMTYDSYHSRIEFSNTIVGKEIQWAIEKNITTKLDINPLLDSIRSRMNMMGSPEAKAIIAKGEEERAKQRAQEEAARKAKEEAEKLKEEAQRKAAEEKNAAKKVWIEANGSERLRLGFTRGHNCEKLYTLELCDSLEESFALDYDEAVKTKERSCPSLEALKLCEDLEKANLPFVSAISIVWLPRGLDDLLSDEDRYGEEPAEGVEAIEIKVNDHYAYHLMG